MAEADFDMMSTDTETVDTETLDGFVNLAASQDKKNHTTDPTIAGVLSSFSQLRDNDKTAVAQYIARGMRGATLGTEESSSSPDDDVVHSCSHCQKLVIHRTQDPYLDEDDAFTHSASLTCSKEDIVNGFLAHCSLYIWVLQLLDEELRKLKLDISQTYFRFARLPEGPSLPDGTKDLEYLSFDSGLEVLMRFPFQSKSSTIQNGGVGLYIGYDIDPHLIDQLYESMPQEKQKSGYRAFLNSYGGRSMKGPFRVSTSSDDPAASYISARPTGFEFSLDDNIDMARKCLTECYETHSLTCPQPRGLMPSRVIDLGTKQPISFVRLHWTEEEETGQYAALSYCWGGEPPIRSTTETVQDFTDGVRFSRFPKTLQDAMTVANRLNIRYLWVDALCIIQDDLEDVSREVSKLPQIFREAYVTISASSARSVNEGFLQSRSSAPGIRLKLPYRTPDGQMGAVLLEEPRTFAPEKDPISLRAWTLQEHILSPRILDFGCTDLWWICRKMKRCGDGDSMNTGEVIGDLSFTLDSWRSIIRDYTRRFITFPGDKLPAISGVAKEYGTVFQSEYLAGIWRFALPADLLWSSARSDISRPTVQRAPSWSWASVDGEVSHKWCPISFRDPALILDCNATPVSLEAPYSAVNPMLPAYLKVRGLMKRFHCDKTRQKLYPSIEVSELRKRGGYVGRVQADADEKLEWDADGWAVVWALIIVQNPTRGLILVPVREGCYRRVGLFYRLFDEGLEGFDTSVITII